MRDLNIDELEQVYGAGGKSRSGCGVSPTPPRCGGSKSKKSKSKKSKSKKNKRGSKGYC